MPYLPRLHIEIHTTLRTIQLLVKCNPTDKRRGSPIQIGRASIIKIQPLSELVAGIRIKRRGVARWLPPFGEHKRQSSPSISEATLP